jgi:hypothetical protein
MHGQYIRSIDRQLASEDDALLWLSRGDLEGETESEITATQALALQTKYHAIKILQTETDSKCRFRPHCIRIPSVGKSTTCKAIW